MNASTSKAIALPSPGGQGTPQRGNESSSVAPPAVQPRPAGAHLTTAQKAALIIAALGPEAAGPIIERIEDKHLRSFARAYAHLQSIPKEVLQGVVQEFVGHLGTDNNDIKGGYEETRELLSQFIGSDDITRLMDDIDVPGGQTVWEKLERTPDDAFAKYLEKQSPQLVAVVLSKISTEQASRILDLFDEGLSRQVILRLSKPIQAKREALKVLSDTLDRDFLSPLRRSVKTRDPGEMIGAMMNNIGSEKRESLLGFISDSVPSILTGVRKSMLTFQDIPDRVPGNAISMVIKELETADFLQAVKFGKQNAPSSVEFIFKNISQRMAKQYEEQLEDLKKVSIEDAEKAQAMFMVAVRKLANAGDITLIDPEIEEEGGED